MAEVKWSLQALDDLEAICLFIARDAPMAARMFASKTFEATDKLAIMPRMGRLVPELNNETIRELILGNYRIIYHVHDALDVVEILTLHHSAKLFDWDPSPED